MLIQDDDEYVPAAIGLDPRVLSKNESIQLLAEILNHVVPLRFPMYQKVQTNLLLETDDRVYFLLDEVVILINCKLSLS